MKFEDIENWNYSVDELSNGVFRIIAKDKHGHKIEKDGFDVERLISDCRNEVFEIDNQTTSN